LPTIGGFTIFAIVIFTIGELEEGRGTFALNAKETAVLLIRVELTKTEFI
jgi:hypothetical protein